MKQVQKDVLDMFIRNHKFVEDSNAISSLRPGLIAANAKMKTVIDDIVLKGGKQEEKTEGETEDKGTKKETLVQALFLVTSGTAGYAHDAGNLVLQGKVNYTLWELRRITDESIVGITNNLLTIIGGVGDPLLATNWGVNAAAITAVEDARDAYADVISEPQQIEDATEAMTEALKPLFAKGREIQRKESDKAANTLMATQLDWFNEYHNSRRIITTGHRITTLEGEAFKAINHSTPIYKLKVTAVDAEGKEFVAYTDETGHYKFVPIKLGIYTLTFSLAGYKDMTFGAFRIKLGEHVIKDVFMEETPNPN